jgi:hypothetical protein
MPFGGYPVFRLSLRDAPVTVRRSSPGLPRPFRALTRSLPAGARSSTGLRRSRRGTRSSPPERLVLFSACKRTGSVVRSPDTMAGVAGPRRSPLVAFRRFQRAAPLDLLGAARPMKERVPGWSRATLSAAPGLFHPGSARELPPSGFCVSPERRPRLRGRSSRAVGAWRRALRPAHLALGCGGLVPPGNGGRPTGVGRPLTLVAFPPLRLSLPPPWVPASRLPPLTCLAERSG